MSSSSSRIAGLSNGSERGPQFLGEHLRLFPGGEVSTFVGLVEVGEGRVAELDPAARGPEDLAGELSEADRDRDRRGCLAGRSGTSLGLSALPVRPGRRTAG